MRATGPYWGRGLCPQVGRHQELGNTVSQTGLWRGGGRGTPGLQEASSTVQDSRLPLFLQ